MFLESRDACCVAIRCSGCLGDVIFALYVMRVVVVFLMCSICVFPCKCWVLVSGGYQVAIRSVVFRMICSLLMCVVDASGDHIVEAY